MGATDRDSFVLKHINSPMAPEYMKYLLEHDTVHGRFPGTCEVTEEGLSINGSPVSLSATRDPTEIPWASVGVDYVCESTGAFTTTEGCMKHIEGGAKKVIISAPAKDADTPTIVVGVNTEDYDTSMAVVSCASCTTNGLPPLVKTINEKFGIKQGLMTTVHAATASQLTVDGSMKGDWRAGRAASANIIPSSTGAAKAVAKCYPVMKGELTGMAFRVPTVDVSVVDLTCELETPTTYDEIKAEVKLASATSRTRLSRLTLSARRARRSLMLEPASCSRRLLSSLCRGTTTSGDTRPASSTSLPTWRSRMASLPRRPCLSKDKELTHSPCFVS